MACSEVWYVGGGRAAYDCRPILGGAQSGGNRGAVTDTSAAKLKDFYNKTKDYARPAVQLDMDQSESLHALGYLTSSKSSSGDDAENSSKIDPKQKIATANLLYEALSLLEQEDFGEAVPRLERVLQQEPNTPIAIAVGACLHGAPAIPASSRSLAEFGREKARGCLRTL